MASAKSGHEGIAPDVLLIIVIVWLQCQRSKLGVDHPDGAEQLEHCQRWIQVYLLLDCFADCFVHNLCRHCITLVGGTIVYRANSLVP